MRKIIRHPYSKTKGVGWFIETLKENEHYLIHMPMPNNPIVEISNGIIFYREGEWLNNLYKFALEEEHVPNETFMDKYLHYLTEPIPGENKRVSFLSKEEMMMEFKHRVKFKNCIPYNN